MSKISFDNTLPLVGGKIVTRSLDDLNRAALICLDREQRRIAPDNALIAVLCDTVRLIREHLNLLKQRN